MTAVRLHRIKWAHRALCSLHVAVAGLAYLAAGSPPGTQGVRYIGVHLGMSFLMLLVWAISGRASESEQRWTLLSGIAARVLLVGCPSFTSVDVTRYLWDGRSVLVGIDPYQVAPDHAPLDLFDGWRTPGVRTDLPTLYPPAAQASFAFSALFGPDASWWAWKVLLLTASIATVIISDRLLCRLARRGNLPLVALSPLLVLETGVGAHVDALAVLALVGALLAWTEKRPGVAGTLMGMGGLLKFSPLLAGVPMFFAADRRSARWLSWMAAGTFGAAYLATALGGYRPFGSLLVFAKGWRFGSPLFEVAATVVGETGAHTLSATAMVVAIIIGGWFGSAGRWLVGVQVAFLLLFAASPVVFPWYLAPLVPALAVAPSASVIAWMTALPLTYEVMDGLDQTGSWRPAAWPLAAIVVAWLIGVAVDLLLRFPSIRRAVRLGLKDVLREP